MTDAGLRAMPVLLFLLFGGCSGEAFRSEASVADGAGGEAAVAPDAAPDRGAIDAGSDALASCGSPALLDRIDPSRMLADLEYLVGLKERRSLEGQTAAATYIRGELSVLPNVEIREHAYSYDGDSYVNLVAVVAGTESDRYVFGGCHYDSTSSDPNLAPGADDNASGTAAILEAARALSACQPTRTVHLHFFSNEENSLAGSKAYLDSIRTTIPPSRVAGMINVDQIGYARPGEDLDLTAAPVHRTFAEQTRAVVEQWTALGVKLNISDKFG